jgi:hypothetical protein
VAQELDFRGVLVGAAGAVEQTVSMTLWYLLPAVVLVVVLERATAE